MAELVIFDCDGVLVDSEALIARVEAELFAEHGAAITVEQIVDTFVGLSEASMGALLARDWGIEYSEALRAQRRERVAASMATDLTAIAGIEAVLAGLAVPMCVASSSGPADLRQRLTVTGLIPYFDGALYSAVMVPNGKPASDLFQFAARQLRVDAAACVVVEDSVHGVEAGRAAGMEVIGFTGGAHATATLGDRLRAHGAHDVVATAEELAAALAERC